MIRCIVYTFIIILFLYKNSIAFDLETLAECSALNNNLNHKYGAQLIDKGETHNTVMNDNLYKSSSAYQLIIMAKISFLEKWNLNTYRKFDDEFQNSDFFGRVFFYDTISMQNLSVSNLLNKISQKRCFKMFQDFGHSPGKEDEILNRFDKIAIYLEKARGF